jgi:ferrous iron transport protein B
VEVMAVIALVGNPNVGKSIFFNYLTGNYVDVSNFPGTTVDVSSGKLGEHLIIDTPGVYGISSFNDEEIVTKKVVLDADMVINVVDANNLDRDLFLTLQLIDMGKPMVIALNMIDEAKKKW